MSYVATLIFLNAIQILSNSQNFSKMRHLELQRLAYEIKAFSLVCCF